MAMPPPQPSSGFVGINDGWRNVRRRQWCILLRRIVTLGLKSCLKRHHCMGGSLSGPRAIHQGKSVITLMILERCSILLFSRWQKAAACPISIHGNDSMGESIGTAAVAIGTGARTGHGPVGNGMHGCQHRFCYGLAING